jgi:hypothetical protein
MTLRSKAFCFCLSIRRRRIEFNKGLQLTAAVFHTQLANMNGSFAFLPQRRGPAAAEARRWANGFEHL